MATPEQNEALRKGECPSCHGPMERRPGMFFSRRVGVKDGLVCPACNSLWDDPDDSFIDAHARAETEASEH